MRKVAPALTLCALASVVAACGHGSSTREGVLHAAGMVRIGPETGPGSPRVIKSGVTPLTTGERVTVADGTAIVVLPGGGRLSLRGGSSVSFDRGPTIQSGDVLMQSPARGAVRMASAVGPVAVQGVARVRRDLALEVATYQGVTTVAAGRSVTVPALEEDTVPAVGLVPLPSPIQLSGADPWDEQFLGTAIDLTGELDGQSSYVTANTPATDAGSVAFYRRAVRPLATVPAFTPALLHAAVVSGTPPPGDALVAASIALAGPGAFAPRWYSVFGLRQQGAQWGVVVLDESANPTELLSLVSNALDRASLAPPAADASTPAFSSAPVTVVPPSTPQTKVAPPTGGRGTPPATTTTAPPARSTPAKPPSVTVPPVTIPPVTQLPPSPLSPILDPVVNLINALTGSHR